MLLILQVFNVLFVHSSITPGLTNPTTVTTTATLTPSWTIGVSGTFDCTLSSYNGELKFASFSTVTAFDSLTYVTGKYYKSIRFSGTQADLNTFLVSSNVIYHAQTYYINASDTYTPKVTDYLELVCGDGTNTYNSENIIGIGGGWTPFCTAGTECTSGQGNCNPLDGSCDCYYPYYGTNCENIDCGWCHNLGECDTTTGICTCDPGYYGNNCEYAYCPKGSSSTNCNSQGYCDIFSGTCVCYEGYYGESCNRKKCLNDCNSNGLCDTSAGTCTCYTNYYGRDCAYKRCPRDCGAYGGCNLITGECNCYDNYSEKDCMFTSCPNSCNSKGICNYYSGLCECNTGYAGVDCSLTQS